MDTVNNRPVGVFDSGVGGISVLRELYRLLPHENYIFYGDSANAPYGTRSTLEVRQLSLAVTRKLLSHQVKALVIACNTATSAAIQQIRQHYPKLPVVGLEPAVKPAVEQFPQTNIAVMATELTLREVKLQKLFERYQDQAKLIKVPAPALVEYVEKGDLNTPEVRAYLTDLLAPLGKLSSIVLGCTHFPFIKPALEQVVGTQLKIIDGGSGAARELQRVLTKADLLNPAVDQGKVTFYNSNPDPAEITLSQRLFQTPLD